MAKLNLLDLQPEAAVRRPEILKLSNDEVALIPFTAEAESVPLHYVDSPSINSYVRCNGSDCDLCRCGKTVATKYLLPIYSPVHRAVVLLPMSDSMKPGSLAPQVTREVSDRLQQGEKRVLFIRKSDNFSFVVRSTVLPATVDDGAGQVKAFTEMLQHGEFELASVYAAYTNEQLRQMVEIRDLLRLRGLIKE